MKPYTRWRPGAFAALVALAALTLGCKKSTTGLAGTPPPAPPSTSGARVELSEPKFAVVEPQKVHASVKYRFVEGKPAEGFWYAGLVELTYGEGQGAVMILGESEGSKFAPEGVLEGDGYLFKPVKPGDVVSFNVKLGEGRTKGGYKAISNVLEGKAQ
jgi:hypothetical protein